MRIARLVPVLLALPASADETVPVPSGQAAIVLFAVEGRALVPIACAAPGRGRREGRACLELVPDGAEVRLESGRAGRVTGPAKIGCQAEVDPADGLRFEPIGLAGRDGALARWAVWPASAAARVEVLGDQRKQSDYRPQLRDGEGLVQLVERDLDGDGKVDRVTSIAIAPQQKPRYRRGGVFFVAGGKGISEVVARHPAGLPMHLLAAVRFDSPRRELLLESGGAVWLARSDGSTWAHGGGWSCQRPR